MQERKPLQRACVHSSAFALSEMQRFRHPPLTGFDPAPRCSRLTLLRPLPPSRFDSSFSYLPFSLSGHLGLHLVLRCPTKEPLTVNRQNQPPFFPLSLRR